MYVLIRQATSVLQQALISLDRDHVIDRKRYMQPANWLITNSFNANTMVEWRRYMHSHSMPAYRVARTTTTHTPISVFHFDVQPLLYIDPNWSIIHLDWACMQQSMKRAQLSSSAQWSVECLRCLDRPNKSIDKKEYAAASVVLHAGKLSLSSAVSMLRACTYKDLLMYTSRKWRNGLSVWEQTQCTHTLNAALFNCSALSLIHALKINIVRHIVSAA